MFFSVITKNLNWEMLAKNLVAFKRWDRVKDENLIWRFTEKTDFRGGVHKEPKIGGELPKKKGELGHFEGLMRVEGGGVRKKERVGEEVDAPMHTI